MYVLILFTAELSDVLRQFGLDQFITIFEENEVSSYQ